MDFEVDIPEGYEVVETDEVVHSDSVYAYTHFFRGTALGHAEHLNKHRVGLLYRYEVEVTPESVRAEMGWWHRFMVVPYQNVLRPKGEKIMEVHPDLLRSSCQLHGLFRGEVCPLCQAIEEKRNG